MKKTSFLYALTGLLVLSNLVLVFFLFSNKPPERQKPREIIIERLKLNDQQIVKYDLLIEQHQLDIRSNEEKVNDLKNKLYLLLNSQEYNTSKDSIINEISKTHYKMEEVHFSHFLDIKSLCDSEQQKDYQILISELTELFSKKHKHKRGKK